MPLRVVLADSHRVFLQGLQELLTKSDASVVGEATDGREAVRVATETTPDVVILRDGLDGLNAADAARKIRAARSGTAVVALSAHTDRRSVVRMLRAGAAGYVLEADSFEELLAAVRVVARGGLHLSPRLDPSVIQSCVDQFGKDDPQDDPALSDREREVLQLVAEGESTRQIAERLRLSVKTVETHRRRIMDKLDIHSVALLTKYAIREGLTSLEV